MLHFSDVLEKLDIWLRRLFSCISQNEMTLELHWNNYSWFFLPFCVFCTLNFWSIKKGIIWIVFSSFLSYFVIANTCFHFRSTTQLVSKLGGIKIVLAGCQLQQRLRDSSEIFLACSESLKFGSGLEKTNKNQKQKTQKTSEMRQTRFVLAQWHRFSFSGPNDILLFGCKRKRQTQLLQTFAALLSFLELKRREKIRKKKKWLCILNYIDM